jgi:hypothetical protein
MAQTVALQRGTTTVSGTSTSTTTLFTQSGGTATRVIVNNLSFYSSTNAQQGLNIGFYNTSSGGQTSLVGYLYRPSANTCYSCQFLPYGSGSPFTGVPPGGTTNIYPSTPLLAGFTSNQDIGGTSPGSINFTYPSAGNLIINGCPANFYMGPSDSLKIKATWYQIAGKSVNYGTVNISYSFTTITES